MRRIGLPAAVLSLASCFGGRGTSPPADQPAPVAVAVGARVTLSLETCGTSTRGGQVCVDFNPQDVHDVKISSGAFEMGPLQVVDRSAQIPLHAVRAGDARLVVPYHDIFGEKTLQISLRALNVTGTALTVICDFNSSTAGAVYPVTTGTSFRFQVQAMAADTALLSGDLELVDAADFVLSPPADELREATAPAQAGSYVWGLAGGSSARFEVYDPGALGLALHATQEMQTGVTIVRVAREVAGAPVCVHGRDERVLVQVTAGACLPATAYAEVVGPMPISLRDGDFSFELATSAAGPCTVEARPDTGAAVSATFDAFVAGPPAGPSPGGTLLAPDGIQLGDPLPVGKDCGGSLSDGDCDGTLEYPPVPRDGDCYLNSEWSIKHLDGTQDAGNAIGDGDILGVGLTTELHATIVGYVLSLPPPIHVGAPQNLRYSVIPDGALQLESLGCIDSLDQVFKLVALQPSTLGTELLELRADNLDDTGRIFLQARAISKVLFQTRDPASRMTATAPVVSFFAGSTPTVTVGYEGGGTRLRGSAPVVFTSDSPSARVTSYGAVYTGDAPGTSITISAPVASQSQTLRVVAASAITGLSGLGSENVPMGISRCVQLLPTDAGGAPIYGVRPSRPRLALTGPALVMGRAVFDQLCLQAFAPGSSRIDLTWGSGSTQQTWTTTL